VELTINHGLWGLIHPMRNLLRPQYFKVYLELLRFRKEAFHDLSHAKIPDDLSIQAYLASYDPFFCENFIEPISTAVWSLSPAEFWKQPAKNFIQFLMHHQYLIGKQGPRWFAFKDSSRSYLDAFRASFKGEILLNARVERLERFSNSVKIHARGQEFLFDHVIVATHPDQALKILADPTLEEKEQLGKWRYYKNRVVLHTDQSVLPANRKLWCTWNVEFGHGSSVITYYLNPIHKLKSKSDFFVSLNPGDRIDPGKILNVREFAHPIFDASSYESQKHLAKLNGIKRTYYCGAYQGLGFHEDGLRSAMNVCDALNKCL